MMGVLWYRLGESTPGGSWKLAAGNFPDISAASRQTGLRRVPARSIP